MKTYLLLMLICSVCYSTETYYDKYAPPKNEIVISSFDGGAGVEWNPMWDNTGTITNDLLQSKTIFAIKATCSDGKRVSFEKAVSSIDYSSYNNIQLNFYIDSADNIAGNIGLMIQTNGSWSNNRYIGFPVFNGWNYIKCNLNEPGSSSTYGSVDLTKVTGFGISIDAKPGKTAIVYFDDLKLSRTSLTKAVVIITADDSWKSFYKYGFSKMTAKGFKGTIFQATSFIVTDTSDTNLLTLSHLNSYQNAGFDVANHTHDHNDFDSVSLAAAIADVAMGEQILRNAGFKASRLLAWPIGHFNDSLIQGIKPYADFARSVNRFWFEYPPFSNPYAIRCRCFDVSTTLSSALECIDSVIKYKGVFVSVFHKLSPVTQDEITWDTLNFNTYINYLKTKVDSGLISVMPLSAFLGQHNTSVTHDVVSSSALPFKVTQTQSLITYVMPVASTVTIRIFSLQGKLLQTIYTMNQPAGSYQIPKRTLKLSKGNYVLEISTGIHYFRNKLVLF